MSKRSIRQAVLILLAVKISTSASAAQTISSQEVAPFRLEEATIDSIHTAVLPGHAQLHRPRGQRLSHGASPPTTTPVRTSTGCQTVNPLLRIPAAERWRSKFQRTSINSMGELHSSQ